MPPTCSRNAPPAATARVLVSLWLSRISSGWRAAKQERPEGAPGLLDLGIDVEITLVNEERTSTVGSMAMPQSAPKK